MPTMTRRLFRRQESSNRRLGRKVGDTVDWSLTRSWSLSTATLTCRLVQMQLRFNVDLLRHQLTDDETTLRQLAGCHKDASGTRSGSATPGRSKSLNKHRANPIVLTCQPLVPQ